MRLHITLSDRWVICLKDRLFNYIRGSYPIFNLKIGHLVMLKPRGQSNINQSDIALLRN